MDTFATSNSRFSPKLGSLVIRKALPPVGYNQIFQNHYNKLKV